MNTHTYNGRIYTVLASFEGEDRAAQANRYMATHTHAALLCDSDGVAIIASTADKGRPADPPDSGFGAGWKSVYATKGSAA